MSGLVTWLAWSFRSIHYSLKLCPIGGVPTTYLGALVRASMAGFRGAGSDGVGRAGRGRPGVGGRRVRLTGPDRVIVVGAGPTGLLLAAELALSGVDCLVLERRD